MEDLPETVPELREMVLQERNRANGLQDRVEQLERERDELLTCANELQIRGDAQETRANELQIRVEQLERERDAQETRANDLQDRVTELERTVDRLRYVHMLRRNCKADFSHHHLKAVF